MARPDDTPVRPADAGTPPAMPRWVKGAAIVVGVLIVVFLILQLTGLAGGHGPGMHSSVGPSPVAGTADR